MDVATDRHSDSRRGLLLKAAVVVPDVLISGLLTLVIIDALPPVIGLGVLTFGAVVSVVLAFGFWEGPIVRLLYGGRRPTSREAAQLAASWQLVSSRVKTRGIQLYLTSAGPPIAAAGRRHVLLAREALDAHRAGRLTDSQVTALIAHGIGRLRYGRTRFDLMLLFWTAPWDIIRGLFVGLGHQLA